MDSCLVPTFAGFLKVTCGEAVDAVAGVCSTAAALPAGALGRSAACPWRCCI